MKEKKIYTHCKNVGCHRKLPYSSAGRKYCDNNNICKNTYNNSKRSAKIAFADHILMLSEESHEYERKLEQILNDECEQTIPINYFEIMEIDLTSPLFTYKYDDLDFIYFSFNNYDLCYSVQDDMVTIRKNDLAK